MLPPGLKLLIELCVKLLAQFLCIALVYYGSSIIFDFELELPLIIKLLFFPTFIILSVVVRVILSDSKNKLDARTRGAVLPPALKCSWPGNVDWIYSALRNEKTIYLADEPKKLCEKYGQTINWRALWEDKIFTTEPEHVKVILCTEFDNFEKGTVVKSHLQGLLGDGVFNSDDQMWRFHRSMTRPFFTKDRISHVEIFDRHADEAITLLKDRSRSSHAVDIQDLFSRFTLDCATEFLFGNCVHVLRAGLPYPSKATASVRNGSTKNEEKGKSTGPTSHFSVAFANVQETVARRLRLGWLWPMLEFWKDKTIEDMEVVNAFIEHILPDTAMKRDTSARMVGGKKIEEGETLLDHLITYTEDRKVLRDEILNIMLAAKDSTASTLTFAIHCLAIHPEVLKRLREEILDLLGTDRSPSYDDLKEMKYLRAVINETLRLYPTVPLNVRSSKRATTLPNVTPGAKPWYVPARTRVIYSVFLMHRRTDLWGPDANEFDPDRFLDSRLHKYLTPNPFIFLPFNAGPRICLGQQFAYNEVGFMLVRLLQTFDYVELAPDAQPDGTRPPAEWANAKGERKSRERVWPKSHLAIYAHGGLWVRLREAPIDEVPTSVDSLAG